MLYAFRNHAELIRETGAPESSTIIFSMSFSTNFVLNVIFFIISLISLTLVLIAVLSFSMASTFLSKLLFGLSTDLKPFLDLLLGLLPSLNGLELLLSLNLELSLIHLFLDAVWKYFGLVSNL